MSAPSPDPSVEKAPSPDPQRTAIVAAALKLLTEGGPEALRVRDMAEAAGCTTMSVYSRFGGKEGVLEAIYVDGFRRFTTALRREMGGPSGDRARRLGTAYRRWAVKNPGAYRVMFTEVVPGFSPSEAAVGAALKAYAVLLGVVESLQADGEFRAGDPGDIAFTMWGMVHGLVMLELADMMPESERRVIDQRYVAALEVIVAGLRP